MTNWDEVNAHARTNGISPEAQASAARHLSPQQFPKYRPAQAEGRAASNWLTSDEGHSWLDNRMAENDRTHGVSTPSGFFDIKDDSEDKVAAATWPNPKKVWDINNRWQSDY